ncbi:glutamate--tRNA ligase family protein [Pontiellaceae bacterium B12219]|nr:glutamate--tRNA ligase family protein [Pontiellaceae bacterium B12219]
MITRFAPSLTGYLHLGHVLHMLYVWGMARKMGSNVLCRIEDHDLSRARPEYESAILETMEWLGFVPDLGMSIASATGSSDFRQSDCTNHYQAVLQTLEKRGLVYGCTCSRKEIQQVMSGGTVSSRSADAEEGISRELCYSGTCSEKGLPLEGNTVRFRTLEGETVFQDLKLGEQRQNPRLQCGDFSLRDRNGQWTYQFACVCDDIRHGVDLVIRGEDILFSTARQIQLFKTLEAPVPGYFHHPLILDSTGNKLSKRQRSESITQLREQGASASELIGKAAFLGGLTETEQSLTCSEALLLFDK